MLNVALRLTDQRSRATEETWAQIGALSDAAGRAYARPPPVCARPPPRDLGGHLGAISPLTVVCVKWGVKYGSGYVATLRTSVARALRGVEHRFACLTDDGTGLPSDIDIIPLQPRSARCDCGGASGGGGGGGGAVASTDQLGAQARVGRLVVQSMPLRPRVWPTWHNTLSRPRHGAPLQRLIHPRAVERLPYTAGDHPPSLYGR